MLSGVDLPEPKLIFRKGIIFIHKINYIVIHYFSNIFEKNDKTNIGLYLGTLSNSPDSKMGTTLASLSSRGKVPSINDILIT